MTVVVTNDDGVDSPGIHVLAALLRSLGHEPVVVAPARDMSGASAAIGKIELDVPTQVRRVTLPPPAADIPAYAVEGPPGLAALLAARRGIDDVEPSLVVSGVNAGTNTGQAILHSDGRRSADGCQLRALGARREPRRHRSDALGRGRAVAR